MRLIFLLSVFIANFSQLPMLLAIAEKRLHSEILQNRSPPNSEGASALSSPVPIPIDSKVQFACDALEKSLAYKFENNPIENIYVRPPSTNTATPVQVAIDVKNIPWIHEGDNQWKMMLDLFQFWKDPRLAYNTEGCPALEKFSLPNADHIWKPDLFFPLAEDGFVHTFPQTNFHLWIAPSGEVTYGQRLTLTMECTGKGSGAGELLCPLILSSYRNPKKQLNIQWVSQNPVQIFWDRLTLKDYQIENVTTLRTEHTIRVSTFDYIIANFRFAKNQCNARPGNSY